MSEPKAKANLRVEVSNSLGWYAGGTIDNCPACKRVFLSPEKKRNKLCPLCFSAELQAQPSLVRREAPESLIPVAISKAQLTKILDGFTHKIPFKTADLTPENLVDRMQLVWWPQWLVDGDLEGEWSGTVGFDYQVQTAQESFGNSGWQSKAKLRTETRYEPRKGYLRRHYDNIPVPALRNHNERLKQIGAYDNLKAVYCEPGAVGQNYVQMPEVQPQELLEQAKTRLRDHAVGEIAQATGADRRREINFDGQYLNLNWTEFLLPVLSTHYLDDQGVTQGVWLNGQSGKIYGRRLASVKKARRISLLMGILPLLAFVSAVIVVMVSKDPALVASMILVGMVALLLIVLSLIPWVRAAMWNSEQNASTAGFK